MEKMTRKERETLLALQAKAKRVQRAEEEFLREADARKAELLSRWGLSAMLQETAAPVVPDREIMADEPAGEQFSHPQHRNTGADE